MVGYLVVDINHLVIEQTGDTKKECFDNLARSWRECFGKFKYNDYQNLFGEIRKRVASRIIHDQRKHVRPFGNIKNESINRISKINLHETYDHQIANETINMVFSLQGFLDSVYAHEQLLVTNSQGRRCFKKGSDRYYCKQTSDTLRLKVIIIKKGDMRQFETGLKGRDKLNHMKRYLDKQYGSTSTDANDMSWDNM